MNIDAQHAEAVPPPDLEIRVTTPWGTRSGQQLQYILNSPSGAVPYTHHLIPGPPIHDPEAFCKRLFGEIEGFRSGVDPTGSKALSVRQDITTIGKNLFQELLPQELQLLYPTLREQARTLLIVSDEAWIPWEMLHPPAKLGQHFLCLEWELSRWLTGWASYSARLNLQQAMAVATAKEFELPQGEDEVKEIQRKLQAASGVEVSAVLNPSWQEFRDRVHREDLDLIHVSGHGRFHESLKESVLQVGEASFRTLHLTEAADSSSRSRRPFVFFNVCQLGRVAESITQVEGWPPRWIRQRRCGGFIGPMWSVRDDSAAEFADIFYREVLGGATLAAALRSTRWALREQSASPLTWLAYSFYGHPNARLVPGQGPLPSTKSEGVSVRSAADVQTAPVSGSSDSSQRTVLPELDTSPLRSSVAPNPKQQQTLMPHPSSQPQRRSRSGKTRIGWGVALGCLGFAGAGLMWWQPPWTSSDTSVQETPSQDSPHEGKVKEGSPPATSTPPAKVELQDVSGDHTTDTEGTLPPRSTTPPPELEPEVQEEPPPVTQAAPQRPFPVSAPQPGKLVILVVDRKRQALDREVASTVQSLFFEDVPGVSATVPTATAPTALAFLGDPGGMLPGNGSTPWGAEYLLLVSADTNPLSDSPGLTSLSLSLQAHLVEAQSGHTLARSASTHTGRGASTHQALTQASKRCLREVLNVLKKENEV